MTVEDDSMELNPLEHCQVALPVPPSYGQCAAAVVSPRVDCVVSPLAVAALFNWDEEDD
jgi:hypothetical protein